MTFAHMVRRLESGTPVPDERTDVDTPSLLARYPGLALIATRNLRIGVSSGAISARLYLPQGAPSGGLVWAHGGAFIGGDLDMPEANWVSLAIASRGYSVLSVDYTKALFGTHFPVPSLDLLDAWNWAVESGDLGTGPLHLGGASAGGNLAAGVTLRLRDGAGIAPASLVLAYPALHAVLPDASEQAQLAASTLQAEARFPPELMAAMAINYAGTPTALADPYAFPSNAALEGLVPTFILNSERDDLRASGEAFGKQAIGAGVTVRMEYEPGAQHGHLDQPHSPEAKLSIARIVDWLDALSLDSRP